jgi:membrane protease YdiL (CAAX protease family)
LAEDDFGPILLTAREDDMGDTTAGKVYSLGKFWIFIGGAFAITWAFYALAILRQEGLIGFGDVFLFLDLSNLGPFAMPIILALACEGRGGARKLAAKLLGCRFHPIWWFAAIAVFPLLNLAGLGLEALLPKAAAADSAPSAPFAITPELVILSIVAPFLEEVGWRGYAMIEIQKRFDALTSTIVIGFLWGIWHFPTVFLRGMMQSSLFFPGYVLNVVLLSFFFTWFFNNTKGSAVLSVLLHIAANAMVGLFNGASDILVQNYAMIILVSALLLVFGEKTMVYAERGTRSTRRILAFCLGAAALNTGLAFLRGIA